MGGQFEIFVVTRPPGPIICTDWGGGPADNLPF